MKSKAATMNELFSKLTERNKDIMILVAKSVDIAQEESEQHVMAEKSNEAECIKA